ncbi:hypothetical protein B0H13DRAFT_913208 [Mycena leptocephala]|nr:hypothetical protein B0H13DRAFT_913208 [Mycena leptocephala]
MQRNLYLTFAVLTIVAHAYGQSLQSRNSSAASCNVTLPITSGSDANAFVLLPYSSDQTWAVTGQVDTGNYNYSAIVPDPVFLLLIVDELQYTSHFCIVSNIQ